jgi:hypothetical protein
MKIQNFIDEIITNIDKPVKLHTVQNRGIKDIHCPGVIYKTWTNMLTRCYSEKIHEFAPTYKNCIVAEEWYRLSNFKAWMEKQKYAGIQLDKDFLSDSKLYSPETCMFIPGWLNKYFRITEKQQNLPIGVSKSGDKYLVYFKKEKFIYSTVLDAYTNYVQFKARYLRSSLNLTD